MENADPVGHYLPHLYLSFFAYSQLQMVNTDLMIYASTSGVLLFKCLFR